MTGKRCPRNSESWQGTLPKPPAQLKIQGSDDVAELHGASGSGRCALVSAPVCLGMTLKDLSRYHAHDQHQDMTVRPYDHKAPVLVLLSALFLLTAFVPQSAHAQLADITVGTQPSGIAYDPAMGELFVANYGSNTVSVISDSTNMVVTHVSVRSPLGVAYDPARGEVWVVNEFGGAVAVIADINDTVVASVPVGSGPIGIAYDSAKEEVFVGNQGSNTVSVISDRTDTVVATVKGVNAPEEMAYDSDKGEIFVATPGPALSLSNTVSVISDNSNKVTANITVGISPYGVVYDAARGEVFVSNQGSNSLSVI